MSRAEQIMNQAEELCTPQQVSAALERLAEEIHAKLGEKNPLVLCVMTGAVVFAGQLLPLLRFPLDFDYIHATRYHNHTYGSELEWLALPRTSVADRDVLILDDILDEGHTLAAIQERCLAEGARSVHNAVLVEKLINKPKPVSAEFVGLHVPDRYVFGCGMDVNGLWRNLPSVYALPEGFSET